MFYVRDIGWIFKWKDGQISYLRVFVEQGYDQIYSYVDQENFYFIVKFMVFKVWFQILRQNKSVKCFFFNYLCGK